MNKKVMVLGAGGSAGIGFTRCIKHDYYTIGTDSDGTNLNFSECNESFLIPRAESSDYIKRLNNIIGKREVFVHSQSDAEVRVIGKNRGRLKAETKLPSDGVIEICQDKFSTYLHLKDTGLVPKTEMINTDNLKKLRYPIWIRNAKGAGGKGSFLAKDCASIKHWIELIHAVGQSNHADEDFIASEYLAGKNFGVDVVFDRGELCGFNIKERLSYPFSKNTFSGITGTADAIQNVTNKKIREKLVDIAIRAINEIDKSPHGIYAVDLKENQGRYYITEINAGRFLTSSLHFFYSTGFNLPLKYLDSDYGCLGNYVPIEYTNKCTLLRKMDCLPKVIK